MSIDQFEVAYQDAIKRLRGSVTMAMVPPIEAYVLQLKHRIDGLEMRVKDLQDQKADNLAIIDKLLDLENKQG